MGPSAKLEIRSALDGVRMLIVEDNFLILADLEATLVDAGAEVVGLCRTAKDAIATLDRQPVAAAVLDFQLVGHTSMPVVRELIQRGIPFLFYTGQLDGDQIRAEWPECTIVSKPAPVETVVAEVARLLAR